MSLPALHIWFMIFFSSYFSSSFRLEQDLSVKCEFQVLPRILDYIYWSGIKMGHSNIFSLLVLNPYIVDMDVHKAPWPCCKVNIHPVCCSLFWNWRKSSSQPWQLPQSLYSVWSELVSFLARREFCAKTNNFKLKIRTEIPFPHSYHILLFFLFMSLYYFFLCQVYFCCSITSKAPGIFCGLTKTVWILMKLYFI